MKRSGIALKFLQGCALESQAETLPLKFEQMITSCRGFQGPIASVVCLIDIHFIFKVVDLLNIAVLASHLLRGSAPHDLMPGWKQRNRKSAPIFQ